MDLDKSLDEQIADKRKTTTQTQPRKGGQAPRQSRERRDAVPYARPPPRSADDKWVHDAFSGPGAGRGRGSNPAFGARDLASVAGTGAGFTGVSPRIEVVGLHYEVTPADLKNIFSKAGTIVQGPTIRYDRSGRSKGEATLEYASYQQAKVAINQFDGAMTKGQTISIRLLPPATPRGAPGAGAGGPPGLVRNNSQGGQAQTGASLLARIAGGGASGGASGGGGGGGVARGGRGGRGGPVAGRGRGSGAGAARGGGRGGKRGPASAGDLDKELDSFMKTDAPAGDDVAMA